MRMDDFFKCLRGKDVPVPIYATIEITHRCNSSCRHCYITQDMRSAKKRDSAELTIAEWKGIIDQLSEAGIFYLIITGGEILMRSDWHHIAKHARERGFAVVLYSNGTLIDERAADKIASLRPLGVEFSLYGANPGTHDSITGVPGSFEKVINATKLMRSRGVNVKLKSIIFNKNQHEQGTMHRLAESMGAKYSLSLGISPRLDGDLAPLELHANGRQIERVSGNEMTDILALNPEEYIQGNVIHCNAGTLLFAIDPQGEVLPCIAFRKSAGSLRKKSFRDIWDKSMFLLRLRALSKVPKEGCRNCDAKMYCYRCPGYALLCTGDYTSTYPEACMIARAEKKAAAEYRRRMKKAKKFKEKEHSTNG